MEHKRTQKLVRDYGTGSINGQRLVDCGCETDCPICAVEKYRKDVLEKIKAKEKAAIEDKNMMQLVAMSRVAFADELIKELETC